MDQDWLGDCVWALAWCWDVLVLYVSELSSLAGVVPAGDSGE